MERTKKPKLQGPTLVRTKKEPFIKRDLEGFAVIDSPLPGSIVEHTGWAPGKNLDGYPCDVYITGGQYLSGGRLSNFWHWRKVITSKSGAITLGPQTSGYGSFRASKKKYDTKILLSLKKNK